MAYFPEYYDDLGLSLDHAWRSIARGASDRKSGFHTMAVGTLGLDGAPQVRTVVLRGASSDNRTVRFHTDTRARKIAEIEADPRVSVHLYDADAKLQLRLSGSATIHRDDELVDGAWAATRDMSRLCYRVTPASASALKTPQEAVFEASDDEARDVFSAVTVKVTSMEWLYLHAKGHRRALYTWSETGDVSQTWLVP